MPNESGEWIMRGVDGFMKRRREEKGGTARNVYAYIGHIKEAQEKKAA